MACLADRALPGVDLLFGDTGYHFAETLGFRDYVAGHYDVNVRSLTPELSVAEQDQRYGEQLWQRDPDLLLRDAQDRADGRRPARLRRLGDRPAAHRPRRPGAQTPLFGWDERHAMIKINPIAAFTDDAGRRLHRGVRDPGEPAAADRLPIHRLRPVHAAGGRPRGRALGPLERSRQGRMRAAPVNDYALFLDLTGRRVLVVGAGAVATRRVARLLEAGAAGGRGRPERLGPRSRSWPLAGELHWAARRFVDDDVDRRLAGARRHRGSRGGRRRRRRRRGGRHLVGPRLGRRGVAGLVGHHHRPRRRHGGGQRRAGPAARRRPPAGDRLRPGQRRPAAAGAAAGHRAVGASRSSAQAPATRTCSPCAVGACCARPTSS